MPTPHHTQTWHAHGQQLSRSGSILGIAFIVFGILAVLGGVIWLIAGIINPDPLPFQLTGIYLIGGVLQIAAGMFIRALGRSVSTLIDMNIAQLEGPGADADL